MAAWLPGFEIIPNARSAGGTYAAGYPWRFVAHTVEGEPSTLAGARAMAASHPYPPHLWVWPAKRWRAQTVPLDRSAFALLQPSGTPPTNKARAIQVEIIGYAADTPTWAGEWWDWLGTDVLRPVIDAGYPINLNNVAKTTGNDGYGTTGKVRMTWAQWAAFDGVSVHANVPDNKHWDIGAGDLNRVARAAATGGSTDMPLDPADRAQLDNIRADVTTAIRELREVAPRVVAMHQGKWVDAEGRGDLSWLVDKLAPISDKLDAIGTGGVNATALAEALAALLVPALTVALGGVDEATVRAAVKQALREGTGV